MCSQFAVVSCPHAPVLASAVRPTHGAHICFAHSITPVSLTCWRLPNVTVPLRVPFTHVRTVAGAYACCPANAVMSLYDAHCQRGFSMSTSAGRPTAGRGPTVDASSPTPLCHSATRVCQYGTAVPRVIFGVSARRWPLKRCRRSNPHLHVARSARPCAPAPCALSPPCNSTWVDRSCHYFGRQTSLDICVFILRCAVSA